jgi:hypothetical protein
VDDDEPAVLRGMDVQLDVVGADLDRPLERRQGVLRLVPARPSVRDHERSHLTP